MKTHFQTWQNDTSLTKKSPLKKDPRDKGQSCQILKRNTHGDNPFTYGNKNATISGLTVFIRWVSFTMILTQESI